MEQQGAAGLTKRQIAQLIEDDQIDVSQSQRDLPLATSGFFLLQCVDQFHRG